MKVVVKVIDLMTDRLMDIGGCRVAFATENTISMYHLKTGDQTSPETLCCW